MAKRKTPRVGAKSKKQVVREAATDGQPEGPATGVAAIEPGVEAESTTLAVPDARGAGDLAAVPAGAAHDHPDVPHDTR